MSCSGSGDPGSASNRNSRAPGTDAAALADVGVDVGDPPAKKITLGEMRAAGVRGLPIYCSDYRCSLWTRINVDQRAHCVQLSDFEPGFVCTACP